MDDTIESTRAPLHGMAALIVEDEVLIGLDTQEAVTVLGADPTILAASLADAQDALQTQTFALAVLDVNLGNDTTSEPIAAALGDIPIVFTTGYEPDAALLARFSAGHVQKPYTHDQLRDEILRIIAARSTSE